MKRSSKASGYLSSSSSTKGIFPSGKQSVTRTNFCRRADLPPHTTASGWGGMLQERYLQIYFLPPSSWFSTS